MTNPIDLTNLEHQISKRQLNAQEPGQPNGKPAKRVMFRLWEVMQEAYGHQWNSQYGEEPTETWERLLMGITPDQIRDGLERLAVRKDTWPPNAQEFRQLCLPNTISPDGNNSAAYLTLADPKHPEYKHYSKSKRIENSTTISKRKQTGNEFLKDIKELL